MTAQALVTVPCSGLGAVRQCWPDFRRNIIMDKFPQNFIKTIEKLQMINYNGVKIETHILKHAGAVVCL